MRNFFVLLLMAVLIAGGGFIYQIKKTSDIAIKKTETPLVSDGYTDIPIENDDVFYGNPGAPVTIIIFGDFSDKTSRQTLSLMMNMIKEKPQDLRLVWKNFPTGGFFLKENFLPHYAAWCAGKENHYWNFIEKITNLNKNSNSDDLYKIADDLKINLNQWQKCLVGDEAKQKISRDVSFAKSIGIDSVPAFFMNNKKINIKDGVNIEDLVTQAIKKN